MAYTVINFCDNETGRIIAGREWPSVPRNGDYLNILVALNGEDRGFKTFLVARVYWQNNGVVNVYLAPSDDLD